MANSSRWKARVKTSTGPVSERALITWVVLLVILIIVLARSLTINGGIHINL